jgi:acyl-ACP thioesterase
VYSDLDINGHVNSIRYIEMLLNTFSLDTLRTTPPKRIEVAYCLESLFGDQLDIYAEVQDGNTHVFEIRKGCDVIVKAAITL